MKRFLIVIISGYVFIGLFVFILAQVSGGGGGGDADSKGQEGIFREEAALESARTRQGAVNGEADEEVQPSEFETGIFETWYESGALSSRWVFQNGLLEGDSTLFFEETETPWIEWFWRAGVQSSEGLMYDRKGNLRVKKRYAEGALQGETRFFYPSGETLTRAAFLQGEIERIPYLYSQDGVLETESLLRFMAQRAAEEEGGGGYFQVLPAPGSRSGAQWTFDGDEVSGNLFSYYEEGVLSSEWPLEGGRISGPVVFYYPDGTTRWYEIPFEAGALHGRAKYYDKEGNLRLEAEYREGRRSGAQRIYYPDGSLWVEMIFSEETLREPPKIYSQGQALYSREEL